MAIMLAFLRTHGFIALLVQLLFSLPLYGQENPKWHLQDPELDGVMGIGAERAFRFLEGRVPDTVIVAIMDNGADLNHEDLKGTFWVNPDEIPGNGVDDDGNGYVDDIHGWNFLGSRDGRNLKMETTGLTRCYARYSKLFGDREEGDVEPTLVDEYRLYQKIRVEYEAEVARKQKIITGYNNLLRIYLRNEAFGQEEVEQIKEASEEVLQTRKFFMDMYSYKLDQKAIEATLSDTKRDLATRLNPEFQNREEIVGDDPDNLCDTIYGNALLNVRGPYHGTGVASIVGALHNESDVDGIAPMVKLMILRIGPNGDERDKDIALAIRYAVNKGAKIINLSFGKKYGCHPEFVEQVLEEVKSKDVLIVHGSGNSAVDTDNIPFHPMGTLPGGERSSNWMNVGASCKLDDPKLAAFFSNYGSQSVDIFAPGVEIPSCGLNNSYSKSSGTSAAAPVVSGIAAVLKAYYPFLTGAQLKNVIMRSAFIPSTPEVEVPGSKGETTAPFSELSVSGGIANLYRAVMLVEKEFD